MSNLRDEKHPDVRLAAAARAGDIRAEDELIQRLRCVPQILHAKNAQIGSPLARDELLDLTQDTLEVVWRKLPSFEGRSSLETWVYAYCQNQLMNAIRSKDRRLAPVTDADVEAAIDPHGDARLRQHEFDHVHLGLEDLERTQAHVIRLKHFEQLTFEEIAARLELSSNTVKTHYYRGLEKLRALLEARARENQA